MKLKKQIDTVIETYKDLAPAECQDYEDYIENNYEEEIVKQKALKKIREGYYENKFRKSQRKETSRLSQGQPALCVYGDS